MKARIRRIITVHVLISHQCELLMFSQNKYVQTRVAGKKKKPNLFAEVANRPFLHNDYNIFLKQQTTTTTKETYCTVALSS